MDEIKQNKTNKRKMGRASKINESIVNRIMHLAKKGLTDIQICEEVGIGKTTLSMWKNKYPDFKSSLKKCKGFADDLVEATLLQRALGYTGDEIKVFFDSKNSKTVAHECKKYYPPDVTAQIFWLKNRRPEVWREKQAEVPPKENTKPNQTINFTTSFGSNVSGEQDHSNQSEDNAI
jgi:transcriptional regulator with XRE-family HTH domain